MQTVQEHCVISCILVCAGMNIPLLYPKPLPKQPEPALEIPLLWITGTSGTPETARGKCVHWYPEVRTPARPQTKPRARILRETHVHATFRFWGAGFLNTRCKCDLANAVSCCPSQSSAQPLPCNVGTWLSPGHGICTQTLQENHKLHFTVITAAELLVCWLSSAGHKQVLWTHSYWPTWVTWEHHPSLEQWPAGRSSATFYRAAICNDRSYRANPNTLKNSDLFWSSSHCKPV